MSLRSRMLAVLLAAATAFSAAFSGTANAAGPVSPDSSVQEESESGNLAEETEKEKESEQEKESDPEKEPEQEKESEQDKEPGQEEETAGTGSSGGSTGGDTSAIAEEPEESNHAPTSEASAEDGAAFGMTQENARSEEEMREESGLWATDRETAAEIEPGLPAAGSKEADQMPAADKMPAFAAEIHCGRYVVKINAAEGVFPEGTRAEVKELSGDAARPYAEQAEEMADSGVATAVIDIRFTDRSGKEIQPSGMVDVVFEKCG